MSDDDVETRMARMLLERGANSASHALALAVLSRVGARMAEMEEGVLSAAASSPDAMSFVDLLPHLPRSRLGSA